MQCQLCGWKRRRSEMAENWKGQWVCKDTCLEERHPQDFVRAVHDHQAVPVSRPEKPDVFVDAVDQTADKL